MQKYYNSIMNSHLFISFNSYQLLKLGHSLSN